MLRNNGLSIVLLSMFLLSLGGQYVMGWHEHNEDQQLHNRPGVGFVEYASTGHFLEATFENWESEFLQMAAFVYLTVFLYQKGSAESKDPDKKERVDEIKASSAKDSDMPGPVRKGGLALALYSHSLSLTFSALFLFSFIMHGVGGLHLHNGERLEHGLPADSLGDYMTSTTFWFESLQNWQSEFLSIAAMVILTIFLREKGSPESKPVDTPHWETGSA